MKLPAPPTSSSLSRRTQALSAATNGVKVVVYNDITDPNHNNPYPAVLVDVSPGSTACGGAQGARTCSVNIPAPASTDDFDFTTYDQPPSGGTFPANANVLATGVTTQVIQQAQLNTFNVAMSGTPVSLRQAYSTFTVVAGPNGTGYASTRALQYTAFDADNYSIIGSYSSPVTVNVAETPPASCVNIVGTECNGAPTGHTTVSVAGGNPSTSLQLTSSTQTLVLNYDGLGAPGYAASIALGGATITSPPAPMVFAPMYVDSTSADFTPAVPGAVTFASSSDVVTFYLRAANVGTSGFTVNQGGCSNVATATNPTSVIGNTYVTFTVTPASGATSGSCSMTFTNGLLNGQPYSVNVGFGGASTDANINNTSITFVPQGITGVELWTTAVSVGAPTYMQWLSTISTPTSADALLVDDLGNLFVYTNGATTLAKYTHDDSSPPNYTQTATLTLGYPPSQLAVGSISGGGTAGGSLGGELVLEYVNPTTGAQTYEEWDPGATGSASRSWTLTPAAPSTTGIAFVYVGHGAFDGNVYTAFNSTCGSNPCVQYNVYPKGQSTGATVFTESRAGFIPGYMALDTNGAVYVTEYQGPSDPLKGLYVYPPAGQVGTETVTTVGAPYPQQIGLDGNNYIYVVNNETVPSTGVPADASHNISVFSPGAGPTSLVRQILSGGTNPSFSDVGPLLVSGGGRFYFSGAAGVYSTQPSGTTTIQFLQQSGLPTTGTPVGTTSLAAWSGFSSLQSRGRTTLSVSGATGSAGTISIRH